MDVVFEDVKFAVVGGAVKTGRFNIAMIAGTDTPDWRKEFHVIDEFRAPQGLIVPSGNPNGFGTMASLCGHKVVTFAASPSFEDPLRAASAKCGDNPIQISTLSDANGPYAAVQSGRADAFFGDFVQSTVQAKQMGAEAIEVTDGTKNLVGFIVAKDKPELAQKLACGLQKVVDSGDAAKIAAKYGIADSVILKKITIGAGETPLSC
jgi:ABC-type amino acid transport substrate-binding protein